MLTTEIMRRMWPHAPIATINAVASLSERVFERYEINTPQRVAHFMAQISHECNAGTIIRENMSYSAERITEVFGYNKKKNRWVHSARVTDAEAANLAHNPPALAERVYGLGNPGKAKELGNARPGDAYRFRGNGMLQLTGGASHRDIGVLVGYPLFQRPELLENPAMSFAVAAAEFHTLPRKKGCNALEAADKDDVKLVTLIVNGGQNGVDERSVWLKRWKTILPDAETPVHLPRGSIEPPPKPLISSKIMQGAGGTAASIAAAAASKVAENANTSTKTVSIQDVADKVQQASDAVTTISTMKDNATAIVQVAKPFLGLAPNTWSLIAALAIGAAAMFIGWTLYERYRKMRDEGV